MGNRRQNQKKESADKPGLVPLRATVIHLRRLLPDASSNLPGSSVGSTYSATLFGLAPDGVHLACRVTTTAGGLLPHPFTLTPGTSPVAVYSLLHMTGITPPGRYPASYPTEPGLSSTHMRRDSLANS